jgi:hypothetical protein
MCKSPHTTSVEMYGILQPESAELYPNSFNRRIFDNVLFHDFFTMNTIM